jgi:hypothetical protein
MANSGLPQLYFCFPYRGVGGISLLFLRFAEYLQRNQLADCTLVDYKDGFMARHVTNSDVKVLEYFDSEKEALIPDGAIAIFQAMTPWSIFPGLQFESNVRFLFWNCHPFNLIPTLPGFRQPMQRSEAIAKLFFSTVLRGYASKMRRFVDLLIGSDALVLMDQANLEVTQNFLGAQIRKPAFVPVAIESNTHAPLQGTQERDFGKGLRVTWLGRITDFKYYPLVRCLEDLNALQPVLDLPVSVICIGEGDYDQALSESLKSLPNLSVHIVSHIEPDELPRFLLSNTDLLLGMGTSALEAARLGIPTLLLDASYGPLPPTYKYKFLYEQEGFTLASVMLKEKAQRGGVALGGLIQRLMHNFSDESQKTRYYFAANHEMSVCASKLVDAALATRLTYSELNASGLLSRSLPYRLFVACRALAQ